jgi:pimeloyl-ACP methyl ester carboxylesterase
VPGTKVYVEAPGHGRPFAGDPSYQALADDLLASAGNATQALGVSLGAGLLLRVLSQHPDRFVRVVLYLPAAFDSPRPSAVRRAAELSEALSRRDAGAVERFVRSELPAGPAGSSVEAYVSARTAFLLASDLGPLLEALPSAVPVLDRSSLRAVTAEVLVVAERDDPVHPVEVATEIAAALPTARLEVLDRGALFTDRARLRRLISDHLAGPTGPISSDQAGDAAMTHVTRQ